MSPLTAPLASLLIFSGFALAQISAPVCTLSALWNWSYNSLGQNPCTVAAYLISTCTEGTYSIPALPLGYSYMGPNILDGFDLCKCNTVSYSLLSACAACQEGLWITWPEYGINCTKTLPFGSFPNPIPSGTRIPHWALLDVTSMNDWSSTQSLTAGDTPEVPPGAVLGPSGVTVAASATPHTSSALSMTVSNFPSTLSSPTATGGSSSNTGAIVGGVVGGVVAISIAVVAIVFFLRRQQTQAPSAAPPGTGAPQPPMHAFQQPSMDNGMHTASTLTGTPVFPVKLYDPSDPTTFPGYDGVPQSPDTPQGLEPPQNGTENSLATMQTSWPRGYHGLPSV